MKRSATRDSGVPWIGQIRADWPILPAKAVFKQRSTASQPDDVHLTPSQHHGVMPQAEFMALTGNQVVLNLSGADKMRHVEPGDYISHLRSFQGGLEYSAYKGKVSAAYTVLSPRKEVEPQYFRFLFKSTQYVQGLQTTTDQMRDGQSIRYGQFALLPLPYPPLAEQRRIAEFLDRETAQIDELIAKQEQLISTLAERQAEEAAELLTQGVDPGGLDRETGMWWAPRIPRGWAVMPIRYLARIRTGSGDTQDAQPDGRFPFYVRSMTVERSERWEFQGPAVLTSGDGAGVGKVFHLARGRFSAHQRVYVLDQFRRISPEYFYFYFSTFFGRVVLAGTAKSTVESLRRPMVGGLKVTIPSEMEQVAIVHALEKRASSYALLTTKARAIVQTLHERRQALISAAVTGQFDVVGAS